MESVRGVFFVDHHSCEVVHLSISLPGTPCGRVPPSVEIELAARRRDDGERMLAASLSAFGLLRSGLARSAVMHQGCAPVSGVTRSVCSASLPSLPEHLEAMKEELESGEAQLFDVREPQEWASGHLKLAKLVPLSDLMEGEVPKYERSLLTYVHCAAGIRVHNAAPVLEAMGFERVVPLPEGFATLAGLGFEYER